MRARQHGRGRTLSNREDTGGGCVNPRTKEVGAPPSVSSNLQTKKNQKKKVVGKRCHWPQYSQQLEHTGTFQQH